MLTALHVVNVQYNNVFSRIFSHLLSDKVTVEVREVDALKLRCVTYIKRHKNINVRKLDKAVKSQRNRLLLSDFDVMEELRPFGYKPFYSSELKRQLCTNTALVLLSLVKNTVKVGLVDINADYTDFVKYLLKFTDDLTVVTLATKVYTQTANMLLEETGAPIRLSKTADSLSDCDLIIAPKGVEDTKVFKKDALILSDRKLKDNTHKNYVFDYVVELPDSLCGLCPSYLDKTYLASALYSVEKLYRLGSLIPTLVVCENTVHTIASLKNKLRVTR
ncbi:MAG: hypothetical protein IIX27_00840 [Ruminococcus sp.]|nr:hypothetical protein [Ruminococcus sp.]